MSGSLPQLRAWTRGLRPLRIVAGNPVAPQCSGEEDLDAVIRALTLVQRRYADLLRRHEQAQVRIRVLERERAQRQPPEVL